jgi:hypothetical protein
MFFHNFVEKAFLDVESYTSVPAILAPCMCRTPWESDAHLASRWLKRVSAGVGFSWLLAAVIAADSGR